MNLEVNYELVLWFSIDLQVSLDSTLKKCAEQNQICFPRNNFKELKHEQ